MPNLVSQLKSLTFLLKWLELALAVVCIALLRDGRIFPAADMDKIAISYMTICGYMLINTVLVIGFFKDEQMPKTLTLLLLGAGGVLWITTGAFMIEHYDHQLISTSARDKLLASAIIALINGVLYLVDGFFILRG